ncbi:MULTISPECIES: riboflavin synthase [Acidithrix]|uniref:Riboflavin synthase n=1 Tax=Acidithrix ferrooxidans TaxID=1280514 RepID=A0A0D8HF59_9ACTN|nr:MULTISPECIES: riboflavin synthase [Acidithrix]KJF16600.1 riboflavin synthase [Acidithrix ferrooxidans]CAG4931068.1 unnamed protein product [Acidithrix sp. C25]
MFTGLVQSIGSVVGIDSSRYIFQWLNRGKGFEIGESISVDGCCLTVVDFSDETFSTDVVCETQSRTKVLTYTLETRVNLEAAMLASDSIGGHFVLGHIDSTAKVLSAGERFRIEISPSDALYVVEKGSIAIDGVSLTVAGNGEDWVEVALIPHTLLVTTLGDRAPGDLVNIEFDVLAKHVSRIASAQFSAVR